MSIIKIYGSCKMVALAFLWFTLNAVIFLQVESVRSTIQYSSICESQRGLTIKEMKDILDSRLKSARVQNTPMVENLLSAKNVTFRVVVENIEPYIYVNTTGNKTMSGYIYELWKILEEELKFKSEYIYLDSCTGKTALKVGQADIMLTPVIITGQDLDHYDHSMPIASSWFELYMKRREGQVNSLSYITAWNSSLWIAFVLTLAFLTIFTWAIGFIRSLFDVENTGNKDRFTFNYNKALQMVKKENSSFQAGLKRCPSLVTCLLQVWGYVTQQGPREKSSCSSRRLVWFVCLVFGWLMTTAYSAALVSRLAVRKTEPLPFTSLSEAATKRTHAICTRVNDFAYSTLFKARTSDTEILPKWVGVLNAPPCISEPKSSTDIRRSICHKDAITLETASIMSALFQTNIPCIATKINKDRYAYVYISLLIRKGFPFKRLLNDYLLKLHTSGLIQKLQQRYLQKNLQLKTPKYSLQVTFQHVELVLQLYSLAMFISLIVLCFETIYYKKCRFNTIQDEAGK